MRPDPTPTHATVTSLGPQCFCFQRPIFCGVDFDFDYIAMALMLMFTTMQHRKQKQEMYISLATHVLRQSKKQKVIQLHNSKATSLVSSMVTTSIFCKIHGKDWGHNPYKQRQGQQPVQAKASATTCTSKGKGNHLCNQKQGQQPVQAKTRATTCTTLGLWCVCLP